MKTICLVRHAKSSWDNSLLSDHDRPLNERGLRDAPLMAKVLRGTNVIFDTIICSSASRAAETAEAIAREFGIKETDVKRSEALYLAQPGKIMQIFRSLPTQVCSFVFVGHNPAITELAEHLSGKHFGNIPTAGLVVIQTDKELWTEIFDSRPLNYLLYDYPKKHRSSY